MRRIRLPLLILVTLVVALLFLGDFLTGRVHTELQNPYTRTKKIVERKFGFERETIVPHTGMEDLYYKRLNLPKVDLWEPTPNSFRVEKFTGKQNFLDGPIAPIMFLDANKELAFLLALPTDAARRAVIRSLFHPRKKGLGPEVTAMNERLAQTESERVRTISLWYDLDRNNFSITPTQWWLKNAHRFGIQPDGAVIAPVASKPLVNPATLRE